MREMLGGNNFVEMFLGVQRKRKTTLALNLCLLAYMRP